MAAKPKIVVVGTGGTIAGRAGSATDLAYSAAQLSVADLLELIPGLGDIAEISGQNLFSLNSKDMGPADWQVLARAVSLELSKPDVSGVVVTHGTDTLEEAALFLDLTIGSDKPVVLTGSMRPATALSADGPANLYQAVQVCASTDACGRGVLVVMNGDILPASHVVKRHSIATSAFSASPGSALGSVYSGHTFFFSQPSMASLAGQFHAALADNTVLPMVSIHYVTAGGADSAFAAWDRCAYAGLVIAAFGCGEIPDVLLPAINSLAADGLTVVVSSRVAGVAVLPETMTLEESGHIVASRHLNPQKSAVLLSLVLAAGEDPARVFSSVDWGE